MNTKMFFMLSAIAMSGCSTMDLGKGGSLISGSSGNSGSQGEAKQLAKCAAPIATVEIDEGASEPVGGPTGMRYVMVAQQYGLPSDPKPLVKLMLAQTNCFKVVDRAAGLRAAKREQELKEAGMLREGSTVKKGRVVEAQYTLQPQIIFSNNNAGGGAAIAGGLVDAFLPGVGTLVAGSLRFKEAQVMITLVNNETLVQEGVAEGSAKSSDIGIGAAFFGGLGAAGGMGYSNTDEGKVVAAALMDAVNKLIPHMQSLQVPQAMPASPVQPQRHAPSNSQAEQPIQPINATISAPQPAKKKRM
ncbi:MAG: CsgG/HfaB family protein [Pseudomonadota bacterium]